MSLGQLETVEMFRFNWVVASQFVWMDAMFIVLRESNIAGSWSMSFLLGKTSVNWDSPQMVYRK